MNIEQLLEMWSQDSKIEETEASKELAKVPSLHSKYLRVRSNHNLIVKKLMFEYTIQRKLKNDYFSGRLNNPEDLEKHNLPPLVDKVFKGDMNVHLDADEDLIKILMKKTIHQEIVDTCDMILKEINNRTYQLSNIVKWELYLKGDK